MQNNANARKTVAAVIRITVGILDANTAHATAAMMRRDPISNGATDVVGMGFNASVLSAGRTQLVHPVSSPDNVHSHGIIRGLIMTLSQG
jgi:hypothetical protein